MIDDLVPDLGGEAQELLDEATRAAGFIPTSGLSDRIQLAAISAALRQRDEARTLTAQIAAAYASAIKVRPLPPLQTKKPMTKSTIAVEGGGRPWNGKYVPWHHDKERRCLTCHEHGASFDGGCQGCGYADPRWCSQHPDDPSGVWEPKP